MTEYAAAYLLILVAYYLRWFLYGKQRASVEKEKELATLSQVVRSMPLLALIFLSFLLPLGFGERTKKKIEIMSIKRTL